MNRPPLEVADLVRAAGRAFIERSRRWITWQHLTVLRAIARCRTAALVGHLDECIDCGYRPAISPSRRHLQPPTRLFSSMTKSPFAGAIPLTTMNTS
jgi:hypothetical protein